MLLESETSLDLLLGGRFAVEQPKKGFRIAMDTLLLAAAATVRAGERALDLGCGVGGVMLALAAREPGLRADGLDAQAWCVALCERNIRRNGWADRLAVHLGDVACLPEAWRGAFDHVVMNPPYHDGRTHTASAQREKRLANTESETTDLGVWMAASAAALVPGGRLTLIHRADRLDEILAQAAAASFGAFRVKPVTPRKGDPAKRVLLRADRDGASGCRVEEPLVLHEADGSESPAARALLREAQPLLWSDS